MNGEDDAAVPDHIRSCDPAGHEELGARRDDVQRRADLVRNPGGELSDGREPFAVAELLQGRDARRGLVGGAMVRLGDPVAHRVDLRRELAHLVVLEEDERRRKIAGAGAPRLVAEKRERAADQPDLKKDRK